MARRAGVTWALALVAVIVAASLGGWALLRNGTGCRFAPEGTCLRVLFVGNSYTSVNDLPQTFARLVRSSGRAVEVSMIAPGGAFLADQAASPEVASAISGTAWTAVVLQEQSMAPASRNVLDSQSIPALLTLVPMVQVDRAQPWLLQTWAHRDGWPEMHMDYAAMQDALDAGYEEMSARAGAPVIRAGDAWRRVLADGSRIALWQDDGSHPTTAGTYLAACAVYRELTGMSPVGLPEHDGLSPEDAAALQAAAAGP